MAQLGEIARVRDDIIDGAVQWYREMPMPEAFQACHPAVIRRAKRMCGGDWRRCVLDNDGGIVVHKKIMWQYERNA